MRQRARAGVGRRDARSSIDLRSRIGSIELANPVMTAAGTAGHGTELDAYLALRDLGAVVVKSLSVEAWGGNPAPRLRETAAGMVNSVGLQNPGIESWLADDLPRLVETGATVVASIWGRSVAEYRAAAERLAEAPEAVVAVEVNLSCPNLSAGHEMFAQSAAATAEVIAATEGCGRPRWAKLTPQVTSVAPIARAALDAGAEAVTLINTVPAMVIDLARRRPHHGGGGGGLSGPAIHAVAVRAVYDCRSALGDVPIIGVGGIRCGADVIEMLLAGAGAVQVGTASFAEPRACERIIGEVRDWCAGNGVSRVADLVGGAHGDGGT